MLLTVYYFSLSGRLAIFRQRLIRVESSAPAAPALGSPIAHVSVGVKGTEKSRGSAVS